MGVLDLSKVDGVVKALSDFDAAVKASKDSELKAITTARGNVQRFASVGGSPDDGSPISSVDLSDFMRLMSSLSGDDGRKTVSQEGDPGHKPDGPLSQGQRVTAARKRAVDLLPTDSSTFSAADGKRYRTEYADTLSGWQEFLDNFYGVASGAAATDKVILQITKVSTDQHAGQHL